MYTIRKTTAFLLAIAGLAITLHAHAGRTCEERRPSAQTVTRAMALAERTMNALSASDHQVVLLARAGQDLTKYGLHYSHFGFAYRQPDGNGGYVWRVLHKLNQCGTGESAIYRQGLGEFFLDDLWRYEAAYVAPAKEIQQKLHPLLLDTRQALQMHRKPYSIVSYVWGVKYQQSNQWAIETFAAAMAPTVRSRQQAQGWLQAYGYEPSTLTIGPLTRLGGRISAANVAFDDHPNEKRFSDRIETVTVDSVFSWFERTGMGAAPVTIR